MIRSIRLIHFMSHDDTTIELADGLTVLIGPNNCGKSAVVAALQILCHNGPSNHVIRHNEKECRVIVTTDDGHVVEWMRTKTSPKYIIDGKPFDRLGKGCVPDELHRILRLSKVEAKGGISFDIHFGEQKSPVFLLDKPPSHAAQFFGASSDAASLIKMQGVHKKRVTDSGRRQLELQETEKRLTAELVSLDVTDSIVEEISRLETQCEQLKQSEACAQRMQDEIAALRRAHIRMAQFQAQGVALDQLTIVPVLRDTRELGGLIEDLTALQIESTTLNAQRLALDGLLQAPSLVTTDGLRQTISAITDSARGLRRAHAARESLGALLPPPVIASVDARADELKSLVRTIAAHKRVHAAHLVFETLSSPPTPIDNTALCALVEHLDGAALASSSAIEASERASVEFNNHDAQMRAWLSDNPQCPTCGGLMDAERVITSHHPCIGGHADE